MIPSRNATLASLALAVLLASLGTSIANVALPTLAQEFSASFQQVQWVVLGYLLAVTTLIVSAGRLGDAIGRRRVLVAGILLFTVASFLAGLAPTLSLLIAARLAQGVGAAVMMSLAIALISDTMPRDQTGRAMGVLGTMSAVGTALGPSLGGLLIASWSWRAIFLVTAPVGALAFVLARAHLPPDDAGPREGRAPFDLAGSVLLVIALASYSLALTTGRGQPGFQNVALWAVALAAGVMLWRVERKAAHPLIQLTLLGDRALRVSLGTSALVAMVVMTTLVVGPFYLARALGLGAATVGLVMSVGPVITAVVGMPAGRITDRLGTLPPTLAGIALMATGSAALALIPVRTGVPAYLAAIVGVTAGYSLFQTANNTAVMQDVQAKDRGVVAGLLSLSRNLGLLTGASAMGAIYAFAASWRGGAESDVDAAARGMHATFAVAAALLLAGLLATMRWRAVHEYSASDARSAMPGESIT